jgi:hypothetical protein
VIRDLPENKVKDIAVAIALERATPVDSEYRVYILNLKNEAIQDVLITSRGYGIHQDEQVKTSTLRHYLGDMNEKSFMLIEPIQPQLFGLNNEYWVSFYINGIIYDKKFTFLPESVVEGNFIKIPLLNKPGVMIL